ncbi:MAG: hypothetical protein EBU90_00100 [Proteobacteria bacterium]|nr:hypothetical protein [Pseudomonadota bacterium]NBP12833.1 hypothetical protein [bacterium]
MKENPYRISRSKSWRKAVLLAKAIMIGNRWKDLATRLRQDPSVTDRLLDQALACQCVYKGLKYPKVKEILGLDFE